MNKNNLNTVAFSQCFQLTQFRSNPFPIYRNVSHFISTYCCSCSPSPSSTDIITSQHSTTNSNSSSTIHTHHQHPIRKWPQTTNVDLIRQFYTIPNPSNIPNAQSTAHSSSISILKYLQHTPIPKHTSIAFEQFLSWKSRKHLCIDVGCGHAWSTLQLANHLYDQDYDVIGIDKSKVRLNRNKHYRQQYNVTHTHNNNNNNNNQNVMILQADIIHFWRLCLQHQIYPDLQYILYPNPYPKTSDLKRRWYGHPIFPVLVALGGRIEVRSSWYAYLDEFKHAYQTTYDTITKQQNYLYNNNITTTTSPSLNNIIINDIETIDIDNPLTNFEAKYAKVGLDVHRLVIQNHIKNHINLPIT